jgi:hypothetical protein
MSAYRGAETVLIPAKGGDRMHDPDDFSISPAQRPGNFFDPVRRLSERDGCSCLGVNAVPKHRASIRGFILFGEICGKFPSSPT